MKRSVSNYTQTSFTTEIDRYCVEKWGGGKTQYVKSIYT